MFQPYSDLTIELPPIPEGATRMYLVFNVTRAMLDKAFVHPAEGLLRIGDVAASLDWDQLPGTPDPLPNVLGWNLTAVAPGRVRATEVRIRASVEYPELVKFVFDQPHSSKVFASRETFCADSAQLFGLDSELPVDEHAFGPVEYRDALDAKIGNSNSPPQRHRRFFAQLDRRTDSTMAEGFLAVAEHSDLNQALPFVLKAARRSLQGRHGAIQANGGTYVLFGHEVNAQYVRYFSLLFWKLFVEHFPPAARPAGDPPDEPPAVGFENWIDVADIEAAFEAFADGQLRLPLQIPELALAPRSFAAAWTTQPSSGLYFLFAEFALLAAETGVHPELWTRLANVMVRSQVLLARRYEPSVPPGEEGYEATDYRGCGYRSGAMLTADDRNRIQQVRAMAGLPDLAVAAADHMARYMGGERPAVAPA